MCPRRGRAHDPCAARETVLSLAAELARAKLLAHDVRDLGAGFDVVIEQALGQVKGERRHLTPLVDGQLSRL